ncbi:MAG: hypothetical protein FJX30_06220, partial [Alphaproteobacteria bacterium]|nr:hypothetical protein [Alphaproteobacteria bacterium]
MPDTPQNPNQQVRSASLPNPQKMIRVHQQTHPLPPYTANSLNPYSYDTLRPVSNNEPKLHLTNPRQSVTGSETGEVPLAYDGTKVGITSKMLPPKIYPA